MQMKFNKNLNDFNRRFADALLPSFPAGVEALQDDDGTLLFRGQIPQVKDTTQIGTHVAVSLDKEVISELIKASPEDREEMTEILINNLGTQVRRQYNPNKIGTYALDIVGKMNILRG